MTKAFGIPVLAPSVRPALTVAYEQTEIILDRLDPFLSELEESDVDLITSFPVAPVGPRASFGSPR